MISFKKVLFLISLFQIVNIQAQENTNSSGGNVIGTNGSINYTIGQLALSDKSDETYTVSPSIQQAFEILNVLDLEINQFPNNQIYVYPNPTTNFVNLSLNVNNKDTLVYQLFDSIGRLLQTKNQLKINETINMQGLHSSIYYLNILENNLVIKTFKIIKN